jgi:hypothetical protein
MFHFSFYYLLSFKELLNIVNNLAAKGINITVLNGLLLHNKFNIQKIFIKD